MGRERLISGINIYVRGEGEGEYVSRVKPAMLVRRSTVAMTIFRHRSRCQSVFRSGERSIAEICAPRRLRLCWPGGVSVVFCGPVVILA